MSGLLNDYLSADHDISNDYVDDDHSNALADLLLSSHFVRRTINRGNDRQLNRNSTIEAMMGWLSGYENNPHKTGIT